MRLHNVLYNITIPAYNRHYMEYLLDYSSTSQYRRLMDKYVHYSMLFVYNRTFSFYHIYVSIDGQEDCYTERPMQSTVALLSLSQAIPQAHSLMF